MKKYVLIRSETKTFVKDFDTELLAKAHQDRVDPFGMFTEIRGA